MAHTLKRGEHIRVTLLLQSLAPRARRALELWALAAASALASLVAFYSVRLAWQSHLFNDISTGNDARRCGCRSWSMAIGTTVLAVAFVDEWCLNWQQRVQAASGEAAHNE